MLVMFSVNVLEEPYRCSSEILGRFKTNGILVYSVRSLYTTNSELSDGRAGPWQYVCYWEILSTSLWLISFPKANHLVNLIVGAALPVRPL